MIHIDDGEFEFDMCGNGEYKRRPMAVGEFLDKSLVICGGAEINWDTFQVLIDIDCQTFDVDGTSQTFENASSGIAYSSFVKLNDSAMWITGGMDVFFTELKSTLMVTVNGSVEDVNLPMSLYGHCMVHYDSNSILIIGGNQNEIDYKSKKTWLVNTNDRSILIEGPTLNKGRELFACDKVKDRFGNILILVVGGKEEDTMEILNTSEMTMWTFGITVQS